MNLTPNDVHNRALIANVYPVGWANPVPPPGKAGRYNLVAVGGGAAGLITSVATAGLGGRSALIERRMLGGDCLNFGCVPSKALLASAHAAHRARTGLPLGVRLDGEVRVDFPAVMERMRQIRAEISANDAAARFRDAGVDVFLGDATFTGPDTVDVGGQTLRFARAVVTTGGRPVLPPIPGIKEVGAITNEQVFNLTELPKRLLVVGGGPIGCELAQAFTRFGSQVTLVEMAPKVLPRDDPDAAALVQAALVRDGIDLRLGVRVGSFSLVDGAKRTHLGDGAGGADYVDADVILVAAGRAPNIQGLGLDAAGVETNRRGVIVDERLRSSNKRIFAAGDVAGRWQFTHAADIMARMVVQNALFFGRKTLSAVTMPWVTYTDPEIAHVGPDLATLAAGGQVRHVETVPFSDVDRAICEGQTEGFARIHLDKKGRILAATVVGEGAGELISELAVVRANGLGLSAIGGTVHPYPTRAEVLKKAADAYSRTRLTPFVAKVLKAILRWRR